MASNGLVQLLGNELLNKKDKVGTEAALSGAKAVGIYFSAHWCPPCKMFTPKLAAMYEKDLKSKGLEIVFVSSDRDQQAFDSYYAEMPWLALPYDARKLKEELSKKYKVQGIPSFVIIDAEGELITKDGRSCVSSDPTGEEFPWHPKPIKELLGNEFVGKDGSVAASALEGKYLGIYFSAHWCPPCRGFTPVFAEVYKLLQAEGKPFEVVFASSDRSEEQFTEYFATMPWLAIPFEDKKRKEALSQKFGVSGIPHLVILDAERNVVSTKAIGKIRSEKEKAVKDFPWIPSAIRECDEDCDGIDEAPSLIVLQEKVAKDVQEGTKKELLGFIEELNAECKKKGEEDPKYNVFFASTEGRISTRIRNECGGLKCGDKVQAVLMDIEDSGAYYEYTKEDVSRANVEAFFQDYENKKLTRKQMGQ